MKGGVFLHIRIYVCPEAKTSFLQNQCLKAIAAEILHKRHTAEYLDVDAVTKIDFDKVFAPDEKRVLLYIGYSKKDSRRDLIYLTRHGIHTLLINYGSANFSGSCSKVLLNYRDAMERCIGYLVANKHDRIALVGVNPSSSTDSVQEESFAGYLRDLGADPSRDIYYNYGSISECFSKFAAERSRYNAIICTNNVVALTLLHRLGEIGVRVPEDVYIISCGCSMILSERSTPTITTIVGDQNEIGRQTVLAYATLMKNPGKIDMTVRIGTKIAVRGSTNFEPDPDTVIFPPCESPTPGVDFYADPDVKSFFSAEALLHSSDELDQGILDGLLAGETYPSIAERLYTSENVISYRIKRMFKITGCQKKGELISLLNRYMKQS